MNDYFSPPQSDLNSPPIRRSSTGFSDTLVEALSKTRPWVLFISILFFIGTVFMVGIGLFMGFAMMVGSAAADSSGLGAITGVGGLLIGALYSVLGFLYLYPGMILFRYSKKIKEFKSSLDPDDLDEALIAQMKFWRYMGIMTLALFALYAVIFVVAIGAGLLLPMMNS